MPRSKYRSISLLLLLGVVLSLFLSVTIPIPVSAQGSQISENPTACEFQPPAADRRPTMDVIRLIEGGTGNSNITWDNTYLGLHRWNAKQWPAVDYLVDTTVAFKNGGVVSWVGYDRAGGGNSIIIDGQGPCQGWRQFMGHLSYNPVNVYQVGQEIGPDEVVGKPGCSGFEGSCTLTAKNGTIPPHNHSTLGFWSNVFSFEDVTSPVAVSGYWWIHPSRVEGSAPAQSAQVWTAISTESPESLNTPMEGFVTDADLPDVAPVVKTSLLEKIIIQILPFRNIAIILAAVLLVVFMVGVIYSNEFRSSTLPFVIALVIVGVFFFVGLEKVKASSITRLTPPREANSFVTYTSNEGGVGFVTSLETTSVTSQGSVQMTVLAVPRECSLPPSYPEEIRRWCEYIEKYAVLNDLEPRFVAAIMVQESGGDPVIMSKAGAVGLLQVMPRDGISAGFQCKNGPCFANRPSIEELKDPEFNIMYATEMLRGLIDYWGSQRDGLMHYGPSDIGYSYVDKVMAIYENHR